MTTASVRCRENWDERIKNVVLSRAALHGGPSVSSWWRSLRFHRKLAAATDRQQARQQLMREFQHSPRNLEGPTNKERK